MSTEVSVLDTVLASDFAQIQAFVKESWETSVPTNPRDSRLFQSAFRTMLSLFYADLEKYDLTLNTIPRSAQHITRIVNESVSEVVMKWNPRGLAALEIAEARARLKVLLWE